VLPSLSLNTFMGCGSGSGSGSGSGGGGSSGGGSCLPCVVMCREGVSFDINMQTFVLRRVVVQSESKTQEEEEEV